MKKKLIRPPVKDSVRKMMSISLEDQNEFRDASSPERAKLVELLLEQKGFVEFAFPENDSAVWVHENGLQVWISTDKDDDTVVYKYKVMAVLKKINNLAFFDQNLTIPNKETKVWYGKTGENIEHLTFLIKEGQEKDIFVNDARNYFKYIRSGELIKAKDYPFILCEKASIPPVHRDEQLAKMLGADSPYANFVESLELPRDLHFGKLKDGSNFSLDFSDRMDLDATRRAGLTYSYSNLSDIPKKDKKMISAWNGLIIKMKKVNEDSPQYQELEEELLRRFKNLETLSTGYNVFSFYVNSGGLKVNALSRMIELLPAETLKNLTNTEDSVGKSPVLYSFGLLYASEKGWSLMSQWADKIGWVNMRLTTQKINWAGYLFNEDEEGFSSKYEKSLFWANKFLDVIEKEEGLDLPHDFKLLKRERYMGVYEISGNIHAMKDELSNKLGVAEKDLPSFQKLMDRTHQIWIASRLIKSNAPNPSVKKLQERF